MVKRKDGRWQESVVYEVDGRPVRKYLYAKTKPELVRKLAEFDISKAKMEDGPVFADVAEAWWEEHEPTLAETTRRGYRPAMSRAVIALGSLRMRKIRPLDINRFMERCVRENGMADKTARTQLMVINLICRFAVQMGYIDVNPAQELRVPRGLSRVKRGSALAEDIAKVKESYDIPFGDFAFWALYTGCRRGELAALTWEDVDMEARTITISKSLYRSESGKMMLKSTKTEAGVRTVPILDKLYEKLTPGTGPVFPWEDGGYLTDRQLMRRWEKYQKLTGVECTPHQLRHAYATMLFEADIDAKDAQYLLGHAQLSTTMDIYTDIREQRRAAIHKKLRDIDIA